MTTSVQGVKDAAARNISMPVVVSTALGVALFGAITYFAVKSGVKPLKDAASIVKGAK